MSILGTEPSSVIISKTKSFKVGKKCPKMLNTKQKYQKQAEAKGMV